MAHFAQLDASNIVTEVIVVSNQELIGPDGKESEAQGVAFCQSLYGTETIWKQTSYNGKFRKHYAGIGYSYDPVEDAFIPPQPYPSWVFNQQTFRWDPPVPYPADGAAYVWDETTTSWIAP